jgi:hypothetical protein
VIAETGADLIVHGHEHRDMLEELPSPAGPVPVHGVASGTYHHNKPDRTARYRIFNLDHGKITSHRVRVWNPASGRFEDASRSDDDGSARQSNPQP